MQAGAEEPPARENIAGAEEPAQPERLDVDDDSSHPEELFVGFQEENTAPTDQEPIALEQSEIQGEASGSVNEEAAEREQFRRLQDINLRIQTRQRSRKVTNSELKENMEEST